MYMNNGSSLLKVVNGLSKTLNIANQMIPLYKQVKPIISNSNKFISGIKSLNTAKPKVQAQNSNNNSNNNNNNNNNNSNNNYSPVVTSRPNLNLPTFFQ